MTVTLIAISVSMVISFSIRLPCLPEYLSPLRCLMSMKMPARPSLLPTVV